MKSSMRGWVLLVGTGVSMTMFRNWLRLIPGFFTSRAPWRVSYCTVMSRAMLKS